MLTNVSSLCVYTLYPDNTYIHQANYLEQVYNMSQHNIHSQVAIAGKKVTNVLNKCLM